jgi:hypothetical protein
MLAKHHRLEDAIKRDASIWRLVAAFVADMTGILRDAAFVKLRRE